MANLVMKMWDCSFLEMTERLGINIRLYVRYVDDCRVFLHSIKRGWVWSDGKLVFYKSQFEQENDSKESAMKRTTSILTGMMCYS